MTNQTILERVRSIVAEVTEVDLERINPRSSPGDFEEWDSLAQVNIVLSLEQEFGRQFSPAQIESMTNVEKIVEIVTAQAG